MDQKKVKITVKSDDIYYIITDAKLTYYTGYSPLKIVGTPGKTWRTNIDESYIPAGSISCFCGAPGPELIWRPDIREYREKESQK